jgi:hypothetical protein
VVEHEVQDPAETIVSSDLNQECESLIVNFQRLSISPTENSDASDPEWIIRNTAMCTGWQTILCNYSANILLREQNINSKEKMISLKTTKNLAHKKKSKMLDCVICFENICDTIIFPCMHFIMCKQCFETIKNNGPKICPLCRTDIQTHSNVFLS